MTNRHQWTVWSVVSLGLIGYLAFSLISQPSTTARTFLPGVTTHGHYQIELQCNACHTPGMGVLQDACVNCHGEELEQATDTHPRSKFTDPGKMHLLEHLDARECITCHQEHVPDRTLAMGLSLPDDYCWHCHQEVGEQRPSHKDFAYNSCGNAGCHNYHDNRALFESFLVSHYDEDDMLDEQVVLALASRIEGDGTLPLTAADQDAPSGVAFDDQLLADWESTAHAEAGINCTACHIDSSIKDNTDWSDKLSHTACQSCHEKEVDGFLLGRHGMRLAAGLSPMTPGEARLPMQHSSFHNELTCVACHGAHRFDTSYAAADACLKCHNDEHSLAYKDSAHFSLWKDELAGEADPGTGVSCATCHMPRTKGSDGDAFVQHNQNNNLRPNDKMIRTVCASCHGLQYSLDALADSELVQANFAGQSSVHVESIDMAKAWSDERARLKAERDKKRAEKKKAQKKAK